MTEYHTCPQCGSTQPALQNFCGECGSALREGVTRPLTAGERATLEDPARLASAPPPLTKTGAGREPNRRALIIGGLGLLIMLAIGVFSVTSLDIGQVWGTVKPEPTPTDFVLVERGHSVKLGPGILLTFTGIRTQYTSDPNVCQHGIGITWLFDIENSNTTDAYIIEDERNMRVVDSTGRNYPLNACVWGTGTGSSFMKYQPIEPATTFAGYTSAELDQLAAAATYLDLHMQISGQRLVFRTPLP